MTPDALFGSAGGRWFSIAAHRPFVEDLAWGLMRALESRGPEALADAVVLTPTRRAGRALQAAFLRHVGEATALLLPQIRTLGDLDEGEPPFETAALALDLPPAISGRRRGFELARLALEHQHLLRERLDAAAALRMGAALGRLFESAAIEEVDGRLDALASLTDGDFAEHWRLSADFLAAATAAWRRRLQALGVVDAPERQVRLLRLLADQWTGRPPAGVVVAAGSTGAAPAQADLLRVIAGLPQGAVVLPGLDPELPDPVWAQIGAEEEQHPQSALKRLLERAEVEREKVVLWPSPGSLAEERRGRWRRRVVNEALRPVEATADWVRAVEKLREDGALEGEDAARAGLAGLTVIEARHEGEAASVAALLLRETLETPGRTAAVVTPDPVMARRIQAALGRWGVVADSSAGEPLSLTPAATLVLTLARAAASRRPDTVSLLALMKHPLTRLGRDLAERTSAARTLERRALRGPAPLEWPRLTRRLTDWAAPQANEPPGAAERRAEQAQAAEFLLSDLRAATDRLGAVFANGDALVAEATRAAVSAAEALARGADGVVGGLWSGASGEAAASLLAALIEESDALPPASAGGFADLLHTLFAGEVVRTAEATHARVRILGAIEGRLARADRLILAGLEEGVWPAPAPTDPFLSRPMRDRLGLPRPERRTGAAAHDFAQAACAPEVVLLHSARRGTSPAVKSRWLWRLQTLAKGAGVELPGRPELLKWARALDRPTEPPRPAKRPAPTPPVEARPNELSVTRVESWVRDPYATYARSILGLKPLQRPSAAMEAAARGSAIHKALERFSESWPDALPDDCAQAILDEITRQLSDQGLDEAAMVRERLLAGGCARWLAGFEAERRADGRRVVVELEGRLPLTVDGTPFTVTARADRLEETPGGVVHVLDYKTGAPPKTKEVLNGDSPQLTLTAAIIAGGGFAGLAKTPGELGYVRLRGWGEAGELCTVISADEAPAAADQALERLERRVRAYRRRDTAYVSWAASWLIGRYKGDYDRLARVWEWHVVGADAEGEA